MLNNFERLVYVWYDHKKCLSLILIGCTHISVPHNPHNISVPFSNYNIIVTKKQNHICLTYRNFNNFYLGGRPSLKKLMIILAKIFCSIFSNISFEHTLERHELHAFKWIN